MIKIRIFRNADKVMTGFHVTGHANAGPHGQDIVCAAISALAQTALLGIGNYLKREVDFDIASGNLSVQLKGAPDDLTSAVLETMLLGFREIESINPKGVRILECGR